jgi:hypothetical protein
MSRTEIGIGFFALCLQFVFENLGVEVFELVQEIANVVLVCNDVCSLGGEDFE